MELYYRSMYPDQPSAGAPSKKDCHPMASWSSRTFTSGECGVALSVGTVLDLQADSLSQII
jgi:hypothetical protein